MSTNAAIAPSRSDRPLTRVKPSIIPPGSGRQPFTLQQELRPFAHWTTEALWVPPKDASGQLANTMLAKSSPFSSMPKRWEAVVKHHRNEFTQVREIELTKSSIRLPKGRLFVSVTERKDFDSIEDNVPACVQTRLEEFLDGPGKRPGVKVYYLKPICVEDGSQLIFTSRQDIEGAIRQIQNEVLSHYRRRFISHYGKKLATTVADTSIAIPRAISKSFVRRRQRVIDSYEAKLEFRRRQTALDAVKEYKKYRTSECSFDDMLSMTAPLVRERVVQQYCVDTEASRAKQKQMLSIALGNLPWFAALATVKISLAAFASSLVFATPAVVVCDPVFVAEMPEAPGVLLNIGHFDEINGVRHIEL